MKLKGSDIGISKEMIKDIADSIAEEVSKKMYYKLMMLRFIPEIEDIKSGRIKALKGKDIC